MKHHIRRQQGFTLVEAAITLAVVATVVGTVAPSFQKARERRHVEGIAAQFETDVQHARSLAVARSVAVRISFQAQAGASCYVAHTGAAGACTCNADGSASCSAGAQALQVARWAAGTGVQIASNSASMLFDPVKGTVTPTATVRVTGNGGAAIHQVVNIMGRVRSCSPNGAFSAYPAC